MKAKQSKGKNVNIELVNLFTDPIFYKEKASNKERLLYEGLNISSL